MSFTMNNYIKSSYIKKVFLENCIKNNNKLLLYFSPIDYNNFNISTIIIKNIKNREEFICPFTKEYPNIISIDLNPLCSYFTDYEGSIFIDTNDDKLLIPLSPYKNVLNIESTLDKSQFKLFLRVLDNGEFRISSIVNKKY